MDALALVTSMKFTRCGDLDEDLALARGGPLLRLHLEDLAASVTGDDQCVCHASILPDRRVS